MADQTTERPKSLKRTLSETFFGFRKNKRSRNDASETPDGSSSDNGNMIVRAESDSQLNKRQKVKDAELKQQQEKKQKEEKDAKDAAFIAQEKAFDELLEPQYRKWRPSGYKINTPPSDRPIRLYADGVFDLFHLGHMRQLEQCKKAFPNVELVVGIPNDKETHKRKGLTVLTDKQRYETVRHCKWVDEVVEDAPWILDMKFMKEHKIDYCAHDDLPYVADGIDDIYKPMKEAGMFIATQRTEGISTSDIITKIIRDYDSYLMRNFARGATRQELNVSWLKKNELEVKKHIKDFKLSWKQHNDNLRHTTKDLYVLVRESLINNNNLITNGKSPLDRFASKYNANGLSRVAENKKGLMNNLLDWVGFQSEIESTDENDMTPIGTRAASPEVSVQTSQPSTPKTKKAVKKITTPKKNHQNPKKTQRKIVAKKTKAIKSD